MEVTTNGSLKGAKGSAGSANGSLKPSLNGHAVGAHKRRVKKGPSLFARALSIFARLLAWYSIFTVFFRCPSTLEACDESSPKICKPYFRLKQSVSPHVQPYYDAYAAPYVELARPYYNTLDNNVITPGWAYATKHGKPLVVQGQTYGQTQWDKNVQPLLVKYQTLAEAQYQQTLGPHVNRASTAVGPYYDIARTSALQTYHELLLPTFEYVQPYAQQGYSAASAFTTDVAVPSAVWAWNKTYLFLDTTVWPQLRVVYVENVEPQLIKIGQRLGRYNEKKSGQKPTAESPARSVHRDKAGPPPLTDPSSPGRVISSSFAKPSASVSSSSTSSSSSEISPEPTVVEPEAPPPASEEPVSEEPVSEAPPAETHRSRAEAVPAPEIDPNETEDEIRRIARETVTEDLKDWQERYSKAADEGAAEIEERVEEITKRMIRRNARTTGKALAEQLQTTVVSELMALRRHILNIVGAVAKGSATQEEGQEQVVAVVRQAGMAIKEKARDVRSWRENYEAEMQSSITEAASQHFTILDSIRDLALQKIGMKWAWMEGITYKDWAKYHLLKGRFEEWQEDLKQLIVTHPGLAAAQNAGADVEDEAMNTASKAAKELARLKQVALWKLAASDDTEEFDSDLAKQAAEAAESAKAAAASAPVSEETASAPATEASVVSESPASKGTVPEQPVAAEKGSEEEQVNAQTSSAGEPEAETVSLGEASIPTESLSTAEESAAPTSPAEEIADTDSSEGTAEPSVDATSSTSSATLSEEDSEATPNLASVPILADPVMENIVELETDKPAPVDVSPESELEEPVIEVPIEEPTPAASTPSVKPALFGAAAQAVPSGGPILDDQFDELPSSLSSFAQSAYSAALSHADHQYSQALSKVSAQIHGTPEPVHEQMLASVTSAYSSALASASSRLGDVVKIAQEQIYGSSTPTNKILPTAVPVPSLPTVDWARIESMASERLEQGRSWAEEQYESAKIAVGLATPTPSTPSEHVNKALENAQHNYYAGLGVAHARYSEFLAAASSAASALTATPTPTDVAGTLSSAASVVSESASSAASVASESAASAASVASENVSSVAAAGYEGAASVVDQAGENWEVLVTKISAQIYGAPTPTPWYESVYSAAGDYASSAVQAAADTGSSMTSAAASYASGAPDEASKQYAAVSSIVSELLVGKEPTLAESVYSRLQAAYSVGAGTVESIASDANEAAKSAGEKVASVASEATEAVKEPLAHKKDEL